MENGREGERITPRPPGILEALIAAALGGFTLPVVIAGWEHFFHSEAPEWAKGSLPNILAFVVLTPAFWLLTRSFAWVRTRRTHRTAEAKQDRISIYVARFGGDDVSKTARASVMDSIRNELGPKRVEVLPAGIQLGLSEGVSLDEAADEATRKARLLLEKKRGDLLIWGQIHMLPAKEPVIELRFVSANEDGSEGQRFGFTDKLMLEPGFGPEMGAALAAVAVALAAPAVKGQGRYLAQTLVPVANRLAPLARSVPASMCADDRAKVLNSYGLLQAVIGEQSGESAVLEEAIWAFREALRECSGDRALRNWALAQNNLGNALTILGSRESGTARLADAVSAYREALNEWKRDRSPHDWAMVQNNLGGALWRLGEREGGIARLEEAVSAFLEASNEWTRERAPLEWSKVQTNLGNALSSLGRRESGTARLEEAVSAYREALKERTRARVSRLGEDPEQPREHATEFG